MEKGVKRLAIMPIWLQGRSFRKPAPNSAIWTLQRTCPRGVVSTIWALTIPKAGPQRAIGSGMSRGRRGEGSDASCCVCAAKEDIFGQPQQQQ